MCWKPLDLKEIMCCKCLRMDFVCCAQKRTKQVGNIARTVGGYAIRALAGKQHADCLALSTSAHKFPSAKSNFAMCFRHRFPSKPALKRNLMFSICLIGKQTFNFLPLIYFVDTLVKLAPFKCFTFTVPSSSFKSRREVLHLNNNSTYKNS